MRQISTEDARTEEVQLLEAEIDQRELVPDPAPEFKSATAWLERELQWMKAASVPFIIHESTQDGRPLLEIEMLS